MRAIGHRIGRSRGHGPRLRGPARLRCALVKHQHRTRDFARFHRTKCLVDA